MFELAEIKGSEKQVAWALEIREVKMETLKYAISNFNKYFERSILRLESAFTVEEKNKADVIEHLSAARAKLAELKSICQRDIEKFTNEKSSTFWISMSGSSKFTERLCPELQSILSEFKSF